MQTKTIKQEIIFRAKPMEVYEALMDSGKHSEFTGAQAQISTKVGGKIVAYDGYIDGKNIELIPGKKIVQTWRASEWPDEHYSKAIFEFEPIAGGTKLKFTQEKVPAEFFDDISKGWKEHYWDKMKIMLEQ